MYALISSFLASAYIREWERQDIEDIASRLETLRSMLGIDKALSQHQLLDIRVVPHGVTDVSQWPRNFRIPSQQVTCHVMPHPALALAGGTSVEIIWRRGQGAWKHHKTLINPDGMFSFNFGCEGSGDYVLVIPVKDDDGHLLAAGYETFSLGYWHPDEAKKWDKATPCLDLPSVDDSSHGGAPVNIPPELCSRYRMDGAAAIGRAYYNE